jgi:hypothetical protein
MGCVPYVDSTTNSRTIVMICLYVFKKKKRVARGGHYTTPLDSTHTTLIQPLLTYTNPALPLILPTPSL